MSVSSSIDASKTYTSAFFDNQAEGSLRSARVVVPLILRLLSVRRVIDVGCGLGTWLKAFQENGDPVVRGVDGSYIDRTRLMIDPGCFAETDLYGPFTLEGDYDLAISLEVAEHLPARAGRRLVAELTRVAPIVLFSAAIPGQGGKGHVNEQWPAYWRALFNRHGFRQLDILRGHILHDDRVQWWYRQNMFLYASERGFAQAPALRAESGQVSNVPFVCVEEGVFAPYTSFGGLLSLLPSAAWRAIRSRFSGG